MTAILQKQFWTQNRQAVVRSALLPVLIFMSAIAIVNTIATEVMAFTFLFGMAYLYIIKPFLVIKYGNELKEIKQPKKKCNKNFVLGNKTFNEEQASKITSSICIVLFCSIFIGAGLPRAHGTPLEILPLVTPYLAFHMYCFCTDNSLSILKVFKCGKGKHMNCAQYGRSKVFEEDIDASQYWLNDWNAVSTLSGHPQCITKRDSRDN